jgi:hypothetical protein
LAKVSSIQARISLRRPGRWDSAGLRKGHEIGRKKNDDECEKDSGFLFHGVLLVPVAVSACLPNVFFEAEPEAFDVAEDFLRPSDFFLEVEIDQRHQGLSEGVGDPVDDPFSVSCVLDQVRVAQNPELMGNPRLLHVEDIHQLADAEIPFKEEPDDPQARRVREGLEDFNDLFHNKLRYEHIFIYYFAPLVKKKWKHALSISRMRGFMSLSLFNISAIIRVASSWRATGGSVATSKKKSIVEIATSLRSSR